MNGRRYSVDHAWCEASEGGLVRVGVSSWLLSRLRGEDLRVHLPDVGSEMRTAELFGTLETEKAVVELYAPCAGTVARTNPALERDPGLVKRDPQGEGWLMEVVGEPPKLMDEATYRARFGFATQGEHRQ